MDFRGKTKQIGSNKRCKATQGGSSQYIPFFFSRLSKFKLSTIPKLPKLSTKPKLPTTIFPSATILQHIQASRRKSEVPETQFQSSQPENFQFNDAQNEEYDSASDDPTLKRNGDETSEDLQPVTEKKRNYTHRQKRKNWVERKELALARAYVDVSKDKQRGNQQRFDPFWERVLEHFSV
uniref:No apical meristem-associated C-terminal domain-containing protein n=1 Tax=Lactuca sativa TaxID=4236 RepID=A0A9R1XNM1_LACSA|nr:hypothetical protein LSAT_V11C300149460 [Lactuca sativa]